MVVVWGTAGCLLKSNRRNNRPKDDDYTNSSNKRVAGGLMGVAGAAARAEEDR